MQTLSTIVFNNNCLYQVFQHEAVLKNLYALSHNGETYTRNYLINIQVRDLQSIKFSKEFSDFYQRSSKQVIFDLQSLAENLVNDRLSYIRIPGHNENDEK